MNQKHVQQSEVPFFSLVWTEENKLYGGDVTASSVYVTGRSVNNGRKRVRERRRGRFVCGLDVAAEGMGRFLLGPLQSGVLQQEMQTEFSLPVQNCW